MAKWLDRFRRDDADLDLPRAIAPGITVHRDSVWAWVTLPTRSTDEENTTTIHRLTVDGSSELRRLLPHDAPFHCKVQWGLWTGEDYRREETERLGGEDKLTPGQREYIALGAARIDQNAYPKRQVLLGIEIRVAQGAQLPSALRKSTRTAGGEGAELEDAALSMHRAYDKARAWHARMAGTSFHAHASTVKELAWSLRRDLRRTVGWLPEGPLAPAGSVARLAGGAHAEPHPTHMVLRTDTGTSLVRFLTPSVDGFPSSDLELPGGEWLRELTLTDDLDEGPAVPIEVSIRGRNLTAGEAAKQITEALSLTKEQGREAAQGTAEEPPEEILEARAVLTERLKEVRQGTVGMVADNVTWIVEAPSIDRLDRLTQSLIDRYGAQGITLWAPENLQHVLYKETVLGDRMRFRDCEQVRPWTTLVGAWFHGGSEVGDGAGPLLGGIIGSTPAPFRTRLTDAQLQNEPVTTVFTGRSRAGKSTALMLALGGEIILNGAHGILTDQKGDLYGIVPFLRAFGVQVTEVSTKETASGSMDFFRYVDDVAEAASRAGDYLALMLGLGDRDGDRKVRSYIRRACQGVAARREPERRSTFHVIEALATATITLPPTDTHPEGEVVHDVVAREIGEELRDLAEDPLARPVAGAPDPNMEPLPTGAGLVYMRLHTARPPSKEKPRSAWSDGERLSVGLLQAAYAYAVYTAAEVKGIPKIVALTELHLITGYDFGRELISWLARMGAALDTNLLLDTQAIAELLLIAGLLDQVSATYSFRVKTDEEADAQAQLLGLVPEPMIRVRQKKWMPGQCEARDRAGRIAPVAWDYLSADIAEWLNTTPDRHAAESDQLEEIAA